MNLFPFRPSSLDNHGTLQLERTKALDKHAAKILKHNPELQVTDNELTLLAVIRQTLVRLTIAGITWQLISAYRALKDMARDDEQGSYGLRDVLRYYGHDNLADKLDKLEMKVLGLPEGNLRPADLRDIAELAPRMSDA